MLAGFAAAPTDPRLCELVLSLMEEDGSCSPAERKRFAQVCMHNFPYLPWPRALLALLAHESRVYSTDAAEAVVGHIRKGAAARAATAAAEGMRQDDFFMRPLGIFIICAGPYPVSRYRELIRWHPLYSRPPAPSLCLASAAV